MKIEIFISLLTFVVSALSFASVPLIVASHKLVPGLKEELEPTNLKPHKSAINMVKKLVTQCSSDEYLIIDIPGLSLDDLTVRHKDDWPFLRKYLGISSTLVGLPWVRDPLDFGFIERYVIKTCDAETINVHDNEEEVHHYIDTRTRVIRLDLDELPTEREPRFHRIREYDDLIRKIIRKLPSPHFTIILSSSKREETHPIPENIVERFPDSYQIFNDIVNEESRKKEVERNERFEKGEINWNVNKNPINKFIENRKKDEIHLFNYELLVKYEKLILTILVMMMSVFFVQFYSLMKWLSSAVSAKFFPRPINLSKKND